jgi:hypothetical protein
MDWDKGRIEVELDKAPCDDREAALAAMILVCPDSQLDDDGGHVFWKCSRACLDRDRALRAAMTVKWEAARKLARERTGRADPEGVQIWEAWDVLYPKGFES